MTKIKLTYPPTLHVIFEDGFTEGKVLKDNQGIPDKHELEKMLGGKGLVFTRVACHGQLCDMVFSEIAAEGSSVNQVATQFLCESGSKGEIRGKAILFKDTNIF